MRGRQSSYVIPSFLSSTYQQPPTTTHHPSNQVFKQSIHFPPMTQYNLHTRKWSSSRFPSPPFFCFSPSLPCVFPSFLLLFSAYLLFSGVVYEPLVIRVSLASARPCDKYNAPLSFFIPMRILASSVSLPPFVTDGTRDGGDGSMMR